MSVTDRDQELLCTAFEQSATVFQALSRVRTRRMGLGYRCETGEPEVVAGSGGLEVLQRSGPLAWTSHSEPVALSELEQALLAWAALGPNGVALADVAVQGGLAGLVSWAGRTIPASSNDCSVDLFVIDDDGVWCYRPSGERSAPVEIAGPDDYHKVLEWWRECRVRVDDARPDVGWASAPPGTHNVAPMGPGQYNLNRPGSSWFVPVGDLGIEWFNMLLSSYEFSGFYLMDPDTGKPAGCDEWIRPGFLEVGFPIPVFDELVLLLHAGQVGCAVQNLRLAAEALGLGAWPVGSYSDDLLLGAYPEMARGLGFEFIERAADTNPSKTFTCIGRAGVKEAVAVPTPWFPTAAAAIDHVRDLRYRDGAHLARVDNWAERDGGPYTSETMSEILEHPRAHLSDWVTDAATATVEWIVERYGCCPANISPVRAKFSTQVHHVDVDFYRKFMSGRGEHAALSPAVLEHFATWHPDQPDPTA